MFLVSESRLLAWLEAVLLQPCVLNKRHLVESFQHYAERLEVQVDGVNQTLLFRIYVVPFSLWPPFDGDVAGPVVSALRHALQVGIAVPEILGSKEFSPGRMAVLTRWVPGAEVDWPLTDQQLDEFAVLLAKLHKAPPPADLPVLKLAQVYTALEQQAQAPGGADARPVLEQLQYLKSATEIPVWLHGDVHPGNFIAGPDNTLTIIDWDETGIADCRFDVANFWGVIGINQSQQAAQTFLDRYVDVSGFELGDIAAWWRLNNAREWLAIQWVKQAHTQGLQVDLSNWHEYEPAVHAAMMTEQVE